MIHRKRLQATLVFIILVMEVLSLGIHPGYAVNRTTPIISTRNNFDSNGNLTPGHTSTDYALTNDVSGLKAGHCPGEIVVYVHGYGPSEDSAFSNFTLATQSLAADGYTHPLVGFSWDSNFASDATATQNGPKLAKFLVDFQTACSSTSIRLMGQDTGARVVLSALNSLSGNSQYAANQAVVESVHLLGAAVGNLEITTTAISGIGRSIERETCELHNLYNPTDTVLLQESSFFSSATTGMPLGLVGKQQTGASPYLDFYPSNYQEEDVGSLIKPSGSHYGYVGLQQNGAWGGDGAIGEVVNDWARQNSSVSCIKNLSQDPGSSGFSQVAVSGNTVYVVWEDNTPGKFTIYLRKSTDHGATFGQKRVLSDSSHVSRYPQIAASNGAAYVVWQDISNPTSSTTRSVVDFSKITDPLTSTVLSDPGHYSQNPRISANQANVYVVWTELDEKVLLRASSDAGGSFGPETLVSDNKGPSYNPQIVANAGEAYVVWTNYTEGYLGSYLHDDDVFFRRIVGGQVSNTINISNDPLPSSNPQVAVAGSNVYVAWNNEGQSGHFDSWIRRSRDDGQSFGQPVNLSNDPGDSYDLHVVATPQNVYAVWTDDSTGNRAIYYKKIDISDTGEKYGPVLTLSNSPTDSSLPEIAVSSGHVIVLYISGDSFALCDQPTHACNFDVFLTTSSDGVNFSPPSNISKNKGMSTWPAPIATEPGYYYVSWTDFTPGNADIFFGTGKVEGFLHGNIMLRTPDRGILPLRRVQVRLVTLHGVETVFTDETGAFTLKLQAGDTTGKLAVNLVDSDDVLEVDYATRGVPALVYSPAYNFSQFIGAQLVFSNQSPRFTLNGASFVPSQINVPQARFANLAGLYYYGLTALDFARKYLPGFTFDDRLPLRIVGYSTNADHDGASEFFEDPAQQMVALQSSMSSLASKSNTKIKIDTIFHEMGHYIVHESPLGGLGHGIDVHGAIHPLLQNSGLQAPHSGYAQQDSSGAVSEGLASFLAAAITDTMLTDPGHTAFWKKASVFAICCYGAYDLNRPHSIVGWHRKDGKFVLNPLNEEFALASLLWQLYKGTSEPFPISIPLLWSILTNPANNAANQRIITTINDVYTVLSNSGQINNASLNQTFGRFDICIDNNHDHRCDNGDTFGRSAWTGIYRGVTFSYPYQGYAYPSRPAPLENPQTSLLLQTIDDRGVELNNVIMNVTITSQDGYSFQYNIDLNNSTSLVGLDLPDAGNATITFQKSGYASSNVTISTDQYLAGILAGQPYADNITATLKRLHNDPPQVLDISGSFEVNTNVTIILVGSDADGDPLSFSTVTPPTYGVLGNLAPVDASSAKIVYTPTPGFIGTDGFSYKANDGIVDSNLANVTLTFRATNPPPLANAGLNQPVDQGSLVFLDGSKSYDPDGNPLSFSWSEIAGPSVTITGIDAANPSFYAPTVTNETVLTFELIVNNGRTSSNPSTVSITDLNGTTTNNRPVANAGVAQTVLGGQPVVLDASQSYDANGLVLVYKWSQISGPPITLSNYSSRFPSFRAPLVNSTTILTFQLQVSNGASESPPAAVTVSVKALPTYSVPWADPGRQQTVDQGATVSLDGTRSFDPQGNTLSYSWTQIAGPPVTVSNSGGVMASFVAPLVDYDTVLAFQLVVQAGPSQSVPSTVNIIVKTIPPPHRQLPIAEAGTGQIVDQGTIVMLDGRQSHDPEGSPLTFHWRQVSGPTVILSNGTAPTPTFQAPQVTNDTIVTFQLTVSDGVQDSSPDSVSIMVRNFDQLNGLGPTTNLRDGTATFLGCCPYTRMAASGNNVFIAWKDSNNSIWLRRSTDNGVTLGHLVSIYNQTVLPGGVGTPEMAVSNGNVYLIWNVYTGNQRYDIFFSRSLDNGATFRHAINLSNSSIYDYGQGVYVPAIAASGNNVYVTWWGDSSGFNIVYFRGSNDNGTSFGPATAMHSDQQAGSYPRITASGTNVYVMWTGDYANQNSNVFLRESTDGGRTFGPLANISNSTSTTSAVQQSISIEALGSNVYLAWIEENLTNSKSYMMFQRSTDTGSTFDPAINLGCSCLTGGLRPKIAMSGPNVYLLWEHKDIDGSALLFTASRDNGTRFGPALYLQTPQLSFLSDFRLAVADTNVYAVWVRYPGPYAGGNTNSDIYLRISRDAGASFSNETNVSHDPGQSDWPSIAASGNVLHIAWADNTLMNASDPRSGYDIFYRQVDSSLPAVDQPPVADAGIAQTVNEGSTVSLNGTRSYDPEGQTLVYTWTQISGPTISLSGASTAGPTFTTPTLGHNALLVFRLIVNDGVHDSIPDNVTITIIQPMATGTPPVANAGIDQTVVSGAQVTLDGGGSHDPNGRVLSFIWTQIAGPKVTLLKNNTANPTFAAPLTNSSERIILQLTVNNGQLSSLPSVVTILVVNANGNTNSPPTADAGNERTVPENGRVFLDGSLSRDPDGDRLSYFWSQIEGPTVSLTGANTTSPTLDAPQVITTTVLTFQLIVNDGRFDSVPATVNILVEHVSSDSPPFALAGPDQVAYSGAQVSLDGSLSKDQDGDSLSYSWMQTTGPTVLLSSSTTPGPSFTAPTATDITVLNFNVTVSDGVFENTASVRVIVWPTKSSVSQKAGHDDTFRLGSIVDEYQGPKQVILPVINVPSPITVRATDSSGVMVTYSSNASDYKGRIVPANCVPPSGSLFPIGTTTVACTATDREGNTATQSFPIMVLPPSTSSPNPTSSPPPFQWWTWIILLGGAVTLILLIAVFVPRRRKRRDRLKAPGRAT